jgi:hypothetical protein
MDRRPLDLIGCWRDAHDSQHGGLTQRQGQARRADSIRPTTWKLRPAAPARVADSCQTDRQSGRGRKRIAL